MKINKIGAVFAGIGAIAAIFVMLSLPAVLLKQSDLNTPIVVDLAPTHIRKEPELSEELYRQIEQLHAVFSSHKIEVDKEGNMFEELLKLSEQEILPNFVTSMIHEVESSSRYFEVSEEDTPIQYFYFEAQGYDLTVGYAPSLQKVLSVFCNAPHSSISSEDMQAISERFAQYLALEEVPDWTYVDGKLFSLKTNFSILLTENPFSISLIPM